MTLVLQHKAVWLLEFKASLQNELWDLHDTWSTAIILEEVRLCWAHRPPRPT